ncbi:MAG TPA: cupin domain-containing protein [archaeon]|nr:cupin domain-containing protein [archaeon]
MKNIEIKAFSNPDEVRTFEKGRVELIKIGDSTVGRLTLQPGWKWSEHVKPIAKTDSCQAPHFQYHISGTMHVLMDDGTEKDVKEGEVSMLAAGHDAWVIGNEPVVVVDFQGLVDYAKTIKKQ